MIRHLAMIAYANSHARLRRREVMSTENVQRTQRPYRYGMVLLCCGALINWIGLTEKYAEPVRYVGIACIIAGAALIACAMCCWLNINNRRSSNQGDRVEHVQVIRVENTIPVEKPPAYEAVSNDLPTYDEAIILKPQTLPRSQIKNTVTEARNSSMGSTEAPQSCSVEISQPSTSTCPKYEDINEKQVR